MTEFTPKAEGITDVMRMVTGKDRVAGECVFDGPASGEGWEEQSHDLNFDAVNFVLNDLEFANTLYRSHYIDNR